VVFIATKRATVSDAFGQNVTVSGALPFVYLKFHVSQSYF
jgi:hypothetical protein